MEAKVTARDGNIKVLQTEMEKLRKQNLKLSLDRVDKQQFNLLLERENKLLKAALAKEGYVDDSIPDRVALLRQIEQEQLSQGLKPRVADALGAPIETIDEIKPHFEERDDETDMDGFQEHIELQYGPQTCTVETQVELQYKNRKI